MKKHLQKVVVLGCLFGINYQVKAQNEMSQFLNTTLSDGQKFLDAYSAPLLKSFATGMNSSWFNTAKVHGLGGFSITFSPNVVFVPSADRNFEISSLGLSKYVTITDPNQTTLATAFGSNKPTSATIHTNPGQSNNKTKEISIPGGMGVAMLPVATSQLAVGVGAGTEVIIRYLPKMSLQDALSVNVLGFGIKHDVKQWIKGIKHLPFDLSVVGSYSKLNVQIKTPLEAEAQSQEVYNPGIKGSNEITDITTNAYNFGVIFSKKLSVFTPYVSVGYQTTTSSIAMKGNYAALQPNVNFDPTYGGTGYDATVENHHPTKVSIISNPFKTENKLSGIRATAGFRLKFGPITFHTDYTYAEYSILSAGLGIHIQSLAPPKL
jgi:hypothetical protein